MSDLIDRDETIKQFCKQDCGCDPKDCLDKTCYEVEIIESVPTHPTPSNTLGALDCVERQAAMDAVREELKRIPTSAIRAMEVISWLPSVQPKIIRCKDCKWRKNQDGATGWLPCRALVTPSDFYCGWAELRGDSE